jgi:hypothetical protein
MSAPRIFLAVYLAFLCAVFTLWPYRSAHAQTLIGKQEVCADFLAALQKKPAHVIFDNCTAMPERQGRPLRATYHVSGVHAARAEAALIKSFGLKRLKRSCCQWDSPAASFKSAQGKEFIVSMVSEESVFTKRSQWREIPRFEIVVEMLTEEI